MKLVRYEHGVARLPKPDFYPMALTSFGEWSASLFKFLKDCTSQYYAHASALARAGFYTDDCSLLATLHLLPPIWSSIKAGLHYVLCVQIVAMPCLMLALLFRLIPAYRSSYSPSTYMQYCAC